MTNVKKIIAAIPKMDDAKLMSLHMNCMRPQPNEPMLMAADKIADAVIQHWNRQLAASRMQSWTPERPETGLLKWLGYAVGQNGETAPVRRRILDRVMSADLPLVSSPAYMDEWGETHSAKRYFKLRRTLGAFADNCSRRPSFELACSHWEADIAYVESSWGHVVSSSRRA